MSETQTQTTAAGANPSTPSPATTTQQSLPTDPWAGLDADLRTYIEKNGYKDIASLARSDMHHRSMIGADKASVLRLPREGRAENPTAWQEIDRALGVPADGKYGEFKPQTGELAVTGDQLAKFDQFMQRSGATPAMRNAALEAFHAINAEVVGEITGALQQEKAAADAANRQQWGAAYTRKMLAAETALNGVDGAKEFDDLMQQQGLADHPVIARMRAAIAEIRGEDGLPQGGGAQTPGGGGRLTPKEAQAKVESLFKDPEWAKAYASGDPAKLHELSALYEQIAAAGNG